MKNNKICLLVLTLFFILILSLSFVSASQDNQTVSFDNEDLKANIDNIEVISSNDSPRILNGGTFEDIQNIVDECEDGDIIELKGNFESIGNSITVNKNLTIKSDDGAVLDGKNISGFFNFDPQKSNAINGLTFINSNTADIYQRSITIGYGKITNCNFTKNNVIYCYNPCMFVNCSFEDTRPIFNAGKVINSSFVNLYDEGAIIGAEDIMNCRFTNNYDTEGVVRNVGLVINSKFLNNKGKIHGAISNAGDVINCTFINNSAINGGSGAIHNVGLVINCSFINNSVNDAHYNSGSAISGSSDVINCTFINNTIKDYGGAVYLSGDIINCNFVNNSALGFYDDGNFKDYNCSIKNCNYVNTRNVFFSGDIVDCTFENSFLCSLNNKPKEIINCNFTNIQGYMEGNVSISKCNFTASSKLKINIMQLKENAHISDCTFFNMNYQILCPYTNVVNCIFEKTHICIGLDYTADSYSYIFNSTFRDNEKDYALELSDGNGCVINCSFINNSGGAIEFGYQNEHPISIIKYSTFVNNSGNYRGCVYGFDLNVSYSNFVNNSARYAAAICGAGNISNCNFINNTANNAGALDFQGTVINSIFIENKATDSNLASGIAGAISCFGSSIINCTFDKNSANYGGAIDIRESTINNCTFKNNYAKSYGSVLSFRTPYYDNTTTISNSIFSDNYAKITRNQLGYQVKNYANSAIVQTGLPSGFDDGILSINNCTGLSKNSDRYKIKTKIVSSPLTMVYKSGRYLIIYLKNNDFGNCPVNNVKVTININGKIYNRYTNNNGQAKLLISLAPKTYIAKITFYGDNFYLKVTKNVKIIVKKITPKVTAPAKSFKSNVKTKRYAITLKDNKNNNIANSKITLKINGKTFTAKTNAKGVATFAITKLTKKGTYIATVYYNGNVYYNKISKQVKIFVK